MNSGIMNSNAQISSGLGISPKPEYPHTIPVLQIVSSLKLGGGENVVATLAQTLPADRYTVSVCCLHREGSLADMLRDKGINVVWLKMRLRYWPISLFKLYRLLRRMKIQIVHTHLHPASIWGRIAAILAGVPVIINTEHNLNLWRRGHHRFVERIVNRYTTKIIAVSEDIRLLRIRSEGMSPQRIITIPNAVDIDRFSRVNSRERVRKQLGIDASSLLIGTVARLEYQKRIDHFLEACHLIQKHFPNIRIVIVGDGTLRRELEAQAKRLNLLPEHVQFLGNRKDVPDLLSAMDIFVLSSEFEGMPIALLEAMAATKPVVATRVGGIPEVIKDGQNGLLVSYNDPPGLAKAILELIKNDDLRQSLAFQAFKTVNECFSTSVFSQRTSSLYDALLEGFNV